MRRKFIVSLLALIFIIAAALIWLVSTESGLHSSVSLLQKIIPAIQIGQAQGRLIDNIDLQQLSYQPETGTAVEIDHIQLQWQARNLLKATVAVEKLFITGLRIQLADSEQQETEATLPELNLPFRVHIAELQLEEVQIQTAGEAENKVLNHLHSTLILNYNTLKIDEFKLDGDDALFEMTGQIALQPPYAMDLSYKLNLPAILTTPLTANGQISGDATELELKQTLGAPLVSSQTITITDALNNLHWSLEATANQIALQAVLPEQQTIFNDFQFNAEGNLNSLTASVKTKLLQPDMPEVSVTADVHSDDFANWVIDSELALSEQSRLQVAGTVDLTKDRPTAEIATKWQNLQWPLQGEPALITSPEGELAFKGSLKDYIINLNTRLDWQQQMIAIAADAKGSDVALNITDLTAAGMGGELTAQGMLDWQTAPLQYQLAADWHDIRLPPSLSTNAVQLTRGNINLSGNPASLTLQSEADVLLDDIKIVVKADAAGQTASGFEQTSLNIKLAQGQALYQGKVLWADKGLITGKVKLNKLNPGVLASEWPGELSGGFDISLTGFNTPSTQVNIAALDVQGTLRQRPVKAKGALAYADDLLNVSGLAINSGRSSLSANGQMQQDKMNFNWSLKSPDLQDLYPDLAGAADASGQVSGTIEQPALKADIRAVNVRYQDYSAQSLNSDMQLVIGQDPQIQLTSAMSGLKLPQLLVEQLNVDIAGKQTAHRIRLKLDSKPLNLSVITEGGLAEKIWRGKLTQFDLSNDEAGKWQLTQQGEILLSASEQQLPRHCWSSANGELCLQGNYKDHNWQAAGEFAAVPVSLFAIVAAELDQLEGALRGQFNLQSGQNQAVSGEGEIYLDDGRLQLEQAAFNQQRQIQLNNTFMRYQLGVTNTEAVFHTEPAIDGVSAINAEIKTAAIETLLANPEQASLQGSLNAAIKDLSLLELSHPAFDDLQGELSLDLAIGGTAARPDINGQAKLANGQIAVIDAGIVLKQVQADISGDLQEVNFNYQAQSGKGTLTGEGTFDLADTGWRLNTHMQGEQLEVMNTPEALVIASPDLSIQVTPESSLITGKVSIPRADLEPTQFNTSVSPSKDVVIISDQPAAQEQGPATEIDITISLGDKVKLKALGFQGRLTGDLQVTGNTQELLLGTGEILVKDGSYQAYGQSLKVEDGSIRFAGGAIDNPELDIKAVRKGKDYLAGLHIEGQAAAPQATLFSEPDMSQDDILSYILLGKPLEQASATDAALLASAATGMGLQNGAMIGDQIASTFGLDEFSVSGDSAENAALQIGKYLSPKLYLSYGIGVFESVSTVELRYQLSKIWALKAESGTESGVDLLYTLER
ncbi:translocation/assembly module TamB domain-containing protein [Methylophaga sp. OBS4]|uniref:translocation/assembly module TamB domain-containing protein n=1 Tax=Methylophaga sp. OBS4 TaxID=2991935 RepID=UPI002253E9D9|nr:translocation/assembly module TamB domain-containing protein [Methylophaga sp. OBS4]MCX4186304.1 translocation/assembly module TamB domain-containing protein [Methylophaga sp. OBS4]